MNLPAPANEDVNWLEPTDLYLSVGDSCEIDRPLFQGDVFTGVPLPSLPGAPPGAGRVPIDFTEWTVMLIPHPCQCYNGDKLRSHLTVAPVQEVPNYDTLGPERDRAFDKFALPDLPVTQEGDGQSISYLANFGRLLTVPREYLIPSRRIACLSHQGLGLLAKRLIRFQLRMPSRLSDTMAYTTNQWNEAFLMQAWVRKHLTLKGYSRWLKTPCVIKALDEEQPLVPADYLTGALDVLIDAVTAM